MEVTFSTGRVRHSTRLRSAQEDPVKINPRYPMLKNTGKMPKVFHIFFLFFFFLNFPTPKAFRFSPNTKNKITILHTSESEDESP